MRFWKIRPLALVAIIATAAAIVHSTPASSQAPVIARFFSAARGATAASRGGVAWVESAPRLGRTLTEMRGIRVAPELELSATRGPFRDYELAKGSIAEADVKEICVKSSAAASSAAYTRLNDALKINTYRLSRRLSLESDDIAHDVLGKLLGKCQEILTGYYKDIPAVVHETLKNRLIEIGRDRFASIDALEHIDRSPRIRPLFSSELSARLDPAIEARDTLRRLSDKLTKREREVLTGMAMDLDPAEIAALPELSPPRITADRVRQIQEQIRKKLGDLDQ